MAEEIRGVSQSFRDILVINQSILANLETQKARADKMLDKYQKRIREEADRPSNRFLDWVKSVEPFLDAVLTSKVADHQLTNHYKSFLKQVVQFEQQQVIGERQIREAKFNFEKLVQNMVRVEQKLVETRSAAAKEILRLKHEQIVQYQKLPKQYRNDDTDHCVWCGAEIEEDVPDDSDECQTCSRIPEEEKAGLYTDPQDIHLQKASPFEIAKEEKITESSVEFTFPVAGVKTKKGYVYEEVMSPKPIINVVDVQKENKLKKIQELTEGLRTADRFESSLSPAEMKRMERLEKEKKKKRAEAKKKKQAAETPTTESNTNVDGKSQAPIRENPEISGEDKE